MIYGYYDSDDDCSFGPMTINEVRRNLRLPRPTKTRRETFGQFKCVLDDSSQFKKLPKKEELTPYLCKMEGESSSNITTQSNKEELENPIIEISSDEEECSIEEKIENIIVNLDRDILRDDILHEDSTSTAYFTADNTKAVIVSADETYLHHTDVVKSASAYPDSTMDKCCSINSEVTLHTCESLEEYDQASVEDYDQAGVEDQVQERQFNDTLDEMEFFLNEEETPLKPITHPSNFYKIPMPDKALTFKKITPIKPKTAEFKSPKTPAPKTSKNSFKNIQSPVGIYINRSPRTPLQMNVKTKQVANCMPAAKISTYIKIKGKENLDCGFPEVYYVPAKTVIKTETSETNLPKYIAKLLPCGSRIIRHVARTNKMPKEKIRQLLDESDAFLDHSFLNCTQDGDVSIHTIRKNVY